MHLMRLVGSVFAGRGVAAAASLSTAILISHVAGPAGKGEYSFVTAIAGLAAQIVGLLAGPAIVVLFPRSNRPSIAAAGLLSIGAFAALALAGGWIASLLGVPPARWSLELALLSLLLATSAYAVLLVYASGAVSLYAWLASAQPCLLLLLLLLAHGRSDDLLGFLVPMLAVSHALPGLTAAWILAKRRVLAGSVDWSHVKSGGRLLAAYGLVVQAANVIQLLSYRADWFVVKHYRGEGELGVYTNAVNVAEGIWLVPAAVATVMLSVVANATSSHQTHDRVVHSARVAFAVALGLTVVACACPPSLWVAIFGAKFAGMRMVLLAIGPGIVAHAPGSVVSSYFGGRGRFHVNAITSAIGLGVGLIGYATLIPRFGIVGAGLASSAAYMAASAALMIAFARDTGVSVRPWDVRLSAQAVWGIVTQLRGG